MGLDGAQFQVDCTYAHGECVLRYFSSETHVVGGWWLGITDSGGELVRTEFLARSTATPGTVRAWIEEFIGYDLADRLVVAARQEVEARLHEPASVAG